MRRWQLAVALDPSADAPLFLQIARAVADDVRRGRLRPGEALPGSRALSAQLGVHRNTALAAYRELCAEGWITTARARGTFVSAALPELPARRFAPAAAPRAGVPARAGFDLAPLPAWAEFDPATPLDAMSAAASSAPRRAGTPAVLVLSGGAPDVALLPAAALARAYRRALARGARTLLAYGDPRGHRGLRRALGEMVSAVRGIAAREDDVLVTRGAQMALDLCARALIRPGDRVAVEALGYRPAWAALRAAGAELVPVPVDHAGMDTAALERLASSGGGPLRAVYLTPHHQYPSTVLLAPGRRLALLAWARAHRVAILEDDYDHEFHYEGRPVLPLASADTAGVVVYIGTLSKLMAPGLRLGFVVAPPPLLARLAALRAHVDRQGDHAVECAVAELFDDGEAQRHARRARRAYQSRRDALAGALRAELGGALAFDVPAGGIALWARVATGLDADAWAARAAELGLLVSTGQRYAFDGRARPFLRLGYALHTERELREAARRLAAAMPAARSHAAR